MRKYCVGIIRLPLVALALMASVAAEKTEWMPAETDPAIEYRWEATHVQPITCFIDFRDSKLKEGTDFQAVITYRAGDNDPHKIARFIRITGNNEAGYGTTNLKGICDTVLSVDAQKVNR